MAQRHAVLAAVADRVPEATGDDCLRLAIDGVDGAGKTTFADELAHELRSRSRFDVRVSVDDFHHVRAHRYRRGRESPAGFWADSFDYERLTVDVLQPLGPGGDRRFRPAAHDVATDAMLDVPVQEAPPGAVLVLDGLFLHRHGLADLWDLSVWLEVPFDITAARLSLRDGSPPDPEHPALARYVQAQRHYIRSCNPARRADLVVDNSATDAPKLR